MRFYLISDNMDTLTGMRLAGIEGEVVHDPESVEKSAEHRYGRGGYRYRAHHGAASKAMPGAGIEDEAELRPAADRGNSRPARFWPRKGFHYPICA